jgi:hypothetical protein
MASSVMKEPFFCSLSTHAERVFSISGSRALVRLFGGERGVSFGWVWFRYCSFFRRTFDTVLLHVSLDFGDERVKRHTFALLRIDLIES